MNWTLLLAAGLPLVAACRAVEDGAAPQGPTVVAGSPADYMIVRHVRLEGTNAQIGEQLARIAQDVHGIVAPTSEPSAAERRLAWLRANWPEQAARADGVAAAFRLSPGADGYDPTELPYNAEVAPGCSTVYYPPASVTTGHAMVSRNYDFPTAHYAEFQGHKAPAGARAFTADPYVIELRPDGGYASLCLCAYNLLGAIDGINEKGLAVALLADDCSLRGEPPTTDGTGVAELTTVRYLLDRCATAAEARTALAAVPYSWTFVPCHYLVGDASGDSFVWEITPDLARRFVVDGGGQPQIVTNHLLSQGDAAACGNSQERRSRLQREIAASGGRLSPDQVARTNACVAVPAAAPGAATMWHSVYDLADRTLRVSFFLGRDHAVERRTPYLEFRLR